MENRLFVLGASDPEMEAIEELLRHAGERYIYATRGGHRVTAGEAYRMDPVPEGETPWGGTMYLVECGDSVVAQLRLFSRTEYADTDPSEIPSDGYVTVFSIDHHRPGDPGFGRAPHEFLAASSIGQMIKLIARLGDKLPAEWGAERTDDRTDRSFVAVAGLIDGSESCIACEICVAISAEKLRELLGWAIVDEKITNPYGNDAEKSVHDVAFPDVSGTEM